MKSNSRSYFQIFSAQLPVLKTEGQERLRRASVLIVGQGRLGGTLTTILASSGVGRVLGSDPQRVSPDTINGPIVLGEFHVGKPKIYALETALHHRPFFIFEPVETSEALSHAAAESTVIISAANTIEGRVRAARQAIHYKKPLVDAAILDGRDALGGHILIRRPETGDWSACPACLYSDPRRVKGSEGLLYPLVASIAAIAATLTIQLITSTNSAFLQRENFVAVDFQRFRVTTLAIEKKPSCRICGPSRQ